MIPAARLECMALNDQQILVTGGGGFPGSFVPDALIARADLEEGLRATIAWYRAHGGHHPGRE